MDRVLLLGVIERDDAGVGGVADGQLVSQVSQRLLVYLPDVLPSLGHQVVGLTALQQFLLLLDHREHFVDHGGDVWLLLLFHGLR